MRCAASVSATSHGTAMTIAIIARGGTCETPYAPSASAPSHGNATSTTTKNIFLGPVFFDSVRFLGHLGHPAQKIDPF